MLAGSIAVSAWGGPRRKIRGIVIGIFLGGIAVAVVGLRASIPLIITGSFLLMAGVPVVNTASQVLWQTKVAPAVQGRVFALRRMIASAVSPIAILAAGPLADSVFEPLMADDGALADTLGSILGTGPGRGIGLMVVLSGLGIMTMAVAGWLHPRVRHLETELPDQLEAADAGDAGTGPMAPAPRSKSQPPSAAE
jgi:hypothetical protein